MSELPPELPPTIERQLQELLLNLGHLATATTYIDIYPIDPDTKGSPYTADISIKEFEC